MQLYTVKNYRNKSGIIDLDTNMLIVPYEFDEIVIKGTCIRLKLNGKWGLIPIDDLYKIVYKLNVSMKHSDNDFYDSYLEDD